jgi:16S rRNA (cytosine967-C5)-methyltransferase
VRLPGRLAAAIEVLETLEAQRRPVAQVLKDWGNAHRFAGSGDRAAIGNLVHDALRHRQSLAARMDDDSPRAAILAAAVFLPGYLDGDLPEFEGDQHAPAPLSDKEREVLQLSRLSSGVPDETAGNSGIRPDYLDVRRDDTPANSPDWLASSFGRVFGSDWAHEVGAMAARAPLDLRLNPFTSKPERVDKALARHKPQRDPRFPLLRRIPATEGFQRAPHITSDEAFQKGWIEVQDAGSQLAAELAVAGIKPRTVLDLCAGAGGKALALSVFMGGKGQVFAHDIDRRRMKDIWPRIKRSKAHNIQVVDPDALATHEIAAQGVDCVLVDAPCTGTGTWRRHPDTKWRVSETALTTRIEEQKTVLNQAAGFVKPGGRLAYITCSLLAEENEDQLVAFLHEHPDFKAETAEAMVASVKRDEVPDTLPSIAVDGFAPGALGLRLTPATSETDGFFIACLTRGPA